MTRNPATIHENVSIGDAAKVHAREKIQQSARRG